jgi:tetratricopeptide (TPR) repeat protein
LLLSSELAYSEFRFCLRLLESSLARTRRDAAAGRWAQAESGWSLESRSFINLETALVKCDDMRTGRSWLMAGLLACVVLAIFLRAGTALSTAWLNLANRDAAGISVAQDSVFGAPCGAAQTGLTQAQSWIEQALRLRPQDGHAARTAGQIEWLRGDCAGALQTWRAGLAEPAPAQEWLSFDLARALYQTGDLPRAAAVFRDLDAGHYVRRAADFQLQQGEIDTAQDLYEFALAIRPSAAGADALSEIYARQGQAARALGVWQRIAGNTADREALHWIAVGEIARRQDKLPEARQAFQTGLTFANDPYDLYLRLGSLLLQMEEWADASAAYGQAAAWEPRASSAPYRQAALAELRLGHYAAAMAWYDRANAAIPTGDPWPNIEAGRAALEHNDVAEAERRYRSALDQSPNHAAALYYLAQLLHLGGRTTEAIQHMELVNDHDFRCEGTKLLVGWYLEAGDRMRSQAADAQLARECQP